MSIISPGAGRNQRLGPPQKKWGGLMSIISPGVGRNQRLGPPQKHWGGLMDEAAPPQTTSARAIRAALMVSASMASSRASETKQASNCEGGK